VTSTSGPEPEKQRGLAPKVQLLAHQPVSGTSATL
jgi:hypothetical protein